VPLCACNAPVQRGRAWSPRCCTRDALARSARVQVASAPSRRSAASARCSDTDGCKLSLTAIVSTLSLHFSLYYENSTTHVHVVCFALVAHNLSSLSTPSSCNLFVTQASPAVYKHAQTNSQICALSTLYAKDGLDDIDNDDDDASAPEEEDYLMTTAEFESSVSEDDVFGSEDDGKPPAWAVLQDRIADARARHRRHESDTGSPEYQVAGMTERINYLTQHLQQHPKDFSTRRGLVALVNKRRRLLNYLSSEDVNRYKELIASLGIRHKAPGLVTTREESYGRFPGQKVVKKHLVSKSKK
jgi:small subunit ribosomal protein S15